MQNKEDIKKKEEETQQLVDVITALEKVSIKDRQRALKISSIKSDDEIINDFNQSTLRLFNIVEIIIKKRNKSNDFKPSGYRELFYNAIKINKRLPIDKFTLMILAYAPQIYNKDESYFIQMDIPDGRAAVDDKFLMIRTQEFRNLWSDLTLDEKESIADGLVIMTLNAHSFLYKTAASIR